MPLGSFLRTRIRAVPVRFGNCVCLFQQSRCSFEIALKAAKRCEIVESDRQHSERPSVVGQLNAPRSEDVPGLIIEQVGRNATSEPRPTDILVVAGPSSRKAASARFSVGAVAAYPSVKRVANPISSRSTVLGGPPDAGSLRTAWAALAKYVFAKATADTPLLATLPGMCPERFSAQVLRAGRLPPRETAPPLRLALRSRGDLPLQPLCHCTVELVERPVDRGREERQRCVGSSGELLGRGGLERTGAFAGIPATARRSARGRQPLRRDRREPAPGWRIAQAQ